MNEKGGYKKLKSNKKKTQTFDSDWSEERSKSLNIKTGLNGCY